VTSQSGTDQQRRDPIHIVPYDAGWPAAFEQQRQRVALALSPWLVGPVEHIGSTSVPGLAAKPIVDMLARIPDHHAGDVVRAMAGIGWTHAPEPDDEPSRKWSFCFPDIGRRTHHLHIFEAAQRTGAPCWPSAITYEPIPATRPSTAGSSPPSPPPTPTIVRAIERARRRSSKGCCIT
jgi:GrpB-like predicted nucleotidyltransferase (UPF0157 family)